jgi:hypothetical protein
VNHSIATALIWTLPLLFGDECRRPNPPGRLVASEINASF